jgi:hypothetical protein
MERDPCCGWEESSFGNSDWGCDAEVGICDFSQFKSRVEIKVLISVCLIKNSF